MLLLYGGSFNPPTLAHRAIICKLKSLYPEAMIAVVPVGDDYHKEHLVPFAHRYEMIKRMVKDLRGVIVSQMENYHPFQGSIETLNRFSEAYHDVRLVIGSDQLMNIKSWIRYTELLKKYPLIVINRHQNDDQALLERELRDLDYQITTIAFDFPFSASDFRQNRHKSHDRIPKEVLAYINTHHLYEGDPHV